MKDQVYGCDREYFLYLVKKYPKNTSKVMDKLSDFLLFKNYPQDYKQEEFKDLNLNYILITDDDYPRCLLNIENPPPVLFYKGNTKLLYYAGVFKYLGVVGCRNPTYYGIQMCEKIVSELSKNTVIISGLAKGIDARAHISALKAKLPTIAVLGTPIDFIYPNENSDLADNIITQGGLIISEVFIGSEPDKDNFLLRNRIIAALSDAILLVESYGRSGALSTCNMALNYGKEIACVPCLALKNSNCNKLIKDGAYLVESSEDLSFLY